MSMPEVVEGGLELVESTGGKCPKGHPATWRTLRSVLAAGKPGPIVGQWFMCDVCSARAIAEGRHVWPFTVVEAQVALANRRPKSRTEITVLDRA